LHPSGQKDYMKNTTLRLLSGIIVFAIAIFGLFHLFVNVVPLYHATLLKWIPLLICIIGFFIAGMINRPTHPKWLPLLFLPLLLFKPYHYLYFPFYLILLGAGILTLLLTRKEVSKKGKWISSLLISGLMGFHLLSQPLIVKKEGFTENADGSLSNAIKVWDFEATEKNHLPEFSFINEQGEEKSLKAFKGSYLFVNFWATWCAPCLEEKPFIDSMKMQLKNNPDIQFIDISLDDDTQRWKNFLDEHQPMGMQLNTGKNDIATRQYFEIPGIPLHLVVDQEGAYRKINDLEYARNLLEKPDRIDQLFK